MGVRGVQNDFCEVNLRACFLHFMEHKCAQFTGDCTQIATRHHSCSSPTCKTNATTFSGSSTSSVNLAECCRLSNTGLFGVMSTSAHPIFIAMFVAIICLRHGKTSHLLQSSTECIGKFKSSQFTTEIDCALPGIFNQPVQLVFH